jgi:CTP synthase (UTP-ammonia lyase)
MDATRIAILGEFNPGAETHVATAEALRHSSNALGRLIEGQWISSASTSSEMLAQYDGLWVAPGPPHIVVENSLRVIRNARENGVPTFGNCGGFQLLVLEIARNLLGMPDAHHEEYAPSAQTKVVVPLSCSIRGQSLPIHVRGPSMTRSLYKHDTVVERFYCRYGIAPEFRARFLESEVALTGVDDSGEVRAFEIAQHPFFLGTLYVPQAQSVEATPHPLVTGFLKACVLAGDAKRPGS